MADIIRDCLFCQKEFSTEIRYLKRGYGKFCSHTCAAKYRNVSKNIVQKKHVLENIDIREDMGFYESERQDEIESLLDKYLN